MKKKVFVSLVMVLMLMVSGASAGKTGVLAESLFGEKNCLGLGICPGDWFDPFYLPDGVTIRGEDITDIWGYGNYNTPIEEGFFNMFWEQPGFPDLKVSFGFLTFVHGGIKPGGEVYIVDGNKSILLGVVTPSFVEGERRMVEDVFDLTPYRKILKKENVTFRLRTANNPGYFSNNPFILDYMSIMVYGK